MAGFDMVRSTIQYGLDVLQVKFQTFGSVVNNILHFNFSGAKSAWEGGLSQLGSITDRYTNQMKGRMADLKTLGMQEPLQQPIHLSRLVKEFLKLQLLAIRRLPTMYLRILLNLLSHLNHLS